jgi:hypothetical protein
MPRWMRSYGRSQIGFFVMTRVRRCVAAALSKALPLAILTAWQPCPSIAAPQTIPELQPAVGAFCAKPFDQLNAQQQKLLVDVPSNRKAAAFVPKLWTTKVIPVLLHTSVEGNAALKKAVTNVLKYMNSMSPAKFAVCTTDTLMSRRQIKSAIIIAGLDSSYCPEGAGGCTAPIGMTERPKKSIKLNKAKSDKSWDLGPEVRLIYNSPKFSEGTIVHELMHALGMLHAFDTPPADKMIEYTPAKAKKLSDPAASYYLSTYDPGSVTNYTFYQPGALNIRYKNCKEEKKPHQLVLKNCAIDPVLKGEQLCLYQGKGCFIRSEAYPTDATGVYIGFEGLQMCMSVLDQAWLVSALSIAKEGKPAGDDDFKIKDLIPGGGCRWP